MNVMFWAGLAFWVIELIALFWFLYECRDETTKKGYILKGAVSSNIVFYGAALTVLYSHFEHVQPSRGALLFLIGTLFMFLGDMGFATMQRKHGGSSKAFFSKIATEHVTIETVTVGVVGSLFTIAFFFQTVAFLNGIRGDIQRFAVPFLVLFLIPVICIMVETTILLSQKKMPEVSTNLFIIGVFFTLLTSALFASACMYSFWLWSAHPTHAILVFTGIAVFGLSLLMKALRYILPDKYDIGGVRTVSRFLNFTSRMMLAGCAFLF